MSTQEYAWKLTSDPFADIGFAVARAVTEGAHERIPDVADMFPLSNRWEIRGHLDDTWLAFRLNSIHGGAGVPIVGTLSTADMAYLRERLLPFGPRPHAELLRLLGPAWFSPLTFTYVGPFTPPHASWPDVTSHLEDWINGIVLPDVFSRNRERVLRAIPTSPQFDVATTFGAMWVLECEETHVQGTGFHLANVGIVTCAHVIGPATRAFKPQPPFTRLKANVVASNADIDLAILNVEGATGASLPAGSADGMNLMSHLLAAGFPNYRVGDTGIATPGLVVGFRVVSGIRRLLTNAAIVRGMSGGPILARDNLVIGVAVTGAERMERARETEDHGIIPIDAVHHLRR